MVPATARNCGALQPSSKSCPIQWCMNSRATAALCRGNRILTPFRSIPISLWQLVWRHFSCSGPTSVDARWFRLVLFVVWTSSSPSACLRHLQGGFSRQRQRHLGQKMCTSCLFSLDKWQRLREPRCNVRIADEGKPKSSVVGSQGWVPGVFQMPLGQSRNESQRCTAHLGGGWTEDGRRACARWSCQPLGSGPWVGAGSGVGAVGVEARLGVGRKVGWYLRHYRNSDSPRPQQIRG